MNNDTTLSADELILIVDEDDVPVRSATRKELVYIFEIPLKKFIEKLNLMAQKYRSIRYQLEEGVYHSEEIKLEKLLPWVY